VTLLSSPHLLLMLLSDAAQDNDDADADIIDDSLFVAAVNGSLLGIITFQYDESIGDAGLWSVLHHLTVDRARCVSTTTTSSSSSSTLSTRLLSDVDTYSSYWLALRPHRQLCIDYSTATHFLRVMLNDAKTPRLRPKIIMKKVPNND